MVKFGTCGSRLRASAVAATLCALGLSACGGAGVSSPVTPSQTPTPSPTPTPTPTPNPIYDTAEYQRSTAAVFSGAISAYTSGATGAGIKIAVVDSGVDIHSAEFAGRIDPASRDIVGSRGIDDEGGHGTSVSAVALAAKNDSGMHGIAFNATLIALRTDEPGTCSDPDGCSHDDNDLATAVDTAVLAGARVINMSLGGSPANTRLRNAIAAATAAGVIIVISAGNDGGTSEGNNPDPLAQIANDGAVARGRVLIAGSTNAAGVISGFSNRAGNGSQHFLATVGESVRSFDHTGAAFLYDGTSYAAPGVAAAVALLAHAFPNLSTDQIIEILYNSARDGGAAGVDTIYGRGVLDLARAFAPQGGASLAGSQVPVPPSDALAVFGGALGDGGNLGASVGGVIILDGYDRAFVADLSSRVVRAAPRRRLAAALAFNTVEAADDLGFGGYSLSVTAPPSQRPWVGLAQQGLDSRVGDDARVTRGLVTGSVTKSAAIGFAAGYGADDLLSRMRGGRGNAFIASSDVLRDDGMAIYGTTGVAVAQRMGGWTFGMAAAEGEAAALDPVSDIESNKVSQFAASISRRFGNADIALTYSRLDEAGTILGAEGSATLGATRATSDFVGVDAAAELGGGWSVGVAARAGSTRLGLAAGGLVADAAPLKSVGFAADVAKSDVLAAGDRLALRISQPLRVEAGTVGLNIPVSYDYATLGVGYQRRTASLAPTGREIALEAAWSLPLRFGRLDSNVFWRQDPGHVEAQPDDIGAALRMTMRF